MFESKKSQNLLVAGAILFIALGVLGVKYFTNVTSENAMPIAVDCDLFDPYVVRIAEEDINNYCEKNELSQRFNFIEYDINEDGGGLESADEIWNTLLDTDYNILIGEYNYYLLNDPREMLESNNLFLVNPDYYTSRTEFTSDRYYGILADDPEEEILIAAVLSHGIEAIVIISSDSPNNQIRVQRATEIYESDGGVVYDHIILPWVNTMNQNVEENIDYTEYLDEANAAVSAAISEYGVDKVGVFSRANHDPVLLYQSKDMDSLQSVPWFIYHYPCGFGFEWADEYAAKVCSYHPISVMVDTEKLESIETTANKGYINSLPVGMQGGIQVKKLGAQHATLYDTCWIMALSVLEANSTDPADVSAVFREVAASYEGIFGNYLLDEAGDRCNFKVGLAKFSLDGSEYINELCGLYDVASGKLETYSNFP